MQVRINSSPYSVITVVLLSLLNVQSLAADFYVEAAVGQTDYSGLDAPGELPEGLAYSSDDSDTSLSFLFGYKFSPYVSIRAAYHDLGEYSLSIESTPPSGSLSGFEEIPSAAAKMAITSFSITVVPEYPVSENAGVFAELGVHSYEAKAKGSLPTYNAGRGGNRDVRFRGQSGEKLFYGLGAYYNISAQFAAKLKYTKFNVSDDTVNDMSVALSYKF